MTPGKAFRSTFLLAVLVSAACGGTSTPSTSPPALPPLVKNSWTWIDVPGTACGDGSRTGMAVNPGDGPGLLVFLTGGGACFDHVTCFVAQAAGPGSFGRTDFEALAAARFPGSILDRSDPANPYRAMSLVFVPYCTGDVHGGDNLADYPDTSGRTHRWHHAGRANVVTFLPWIAAAFPAASPLVVSGSSAGGFGALLNYDSFRRTFPEADAVLVDDSGPPLVGGDIPPALVAVWVAAWRIDRVVTPLCPACLADFSKLFPTLAGRYPHDRLALLSSTQDQVIRSFFGYLDGSAFEAAVGRLEGALDPVAGARYFVVAGSSHTLLPTPSTFTSGGVELRPWLAQQLAGDPAWKSAKP
jgi:hypothetical protein